MFIGDGSNRMVGKSGIFQNHLGLFSNKFLGRVPTGNRIGSRRSFLGGVGSEKRLYDVLAGTGLEVMVSQHHANNISGGGPFDQNSNSQKSNLSGALQAEDKYTPGQTKHLTLANHQRNLQNSNIGHNHLSGISNLLIPKKLNHCQIPNNIASNFKQKIGSFPALPDSQKLVSNSARQIGSFGEYSQIPQQYSIHPFSSAQKVQMHKDRSKSNSKSKSKSKNFEPFLENIREDSERIPESNRPNSQKDGSRESLLERDSLFKGFVVRRNVFIGEGVSPAIPADLEPNFDSKRNQKVRNELEFDRNLNPFMITEQEVTYFFGGRHVNLIFNMGFGCLEYISKKNHNKKMILDLSLIYISNM